MFEFIFQKEISKTVNNFRNTECYTIKRSFCEYKLKMINIQAHYHKNHKSST